MKIHFKVTLVCLTGVLAWWGYRRSTSHLLSAAPVSIEGPYWDKKQNAARGVIVNKTGRSIRSVTLLVRVYGGGGSKWAHEETQIENLKPFESRPFDRKMIEYWRSFDNLKLVLDSITTRDPETRVFGRDDDEAGFAVASKGVSPSTAEPEEKGDDRQQ